MQKILRSFPNLFFVLIILIMGNGCTQSPPLYLVASTYTDSGSEGIYLYHFNPESGALEKISSTRKGDNPSYVKLRNNFLYAANETGGDQPGMVSAFQIDRNTGVFTYLGAQKSGGDAPCYVDITQDGKWLAVGNYSGGNFSVYQIKKDGSLAEAAQTINHSGSGPDKDRQDAPHVHSTVFSPDQKFLLVNDLGTDEIAVYSFDGNAKKPVQEKPHSVFNLSPGAGPRHITFDENGEYVYLVRELDGKVSVLSFQNGTLTQIQEVNIDPAKKGTGIDGAEIVLSPDNKFLYVSARGKENSISIFSVDASTKKLTYVDYVPSGGENPRNFIIDPTGQYLLVAHQNSNNIVVFKRDKKTGLLEKTSNGVELPKPVCLKIGSLQEL